MIRVLLPGLWTVLLAAWAWSPVPARACPFCNAVQMTLSEEIQQSDLAVLAKLLERPEAPVEAEPNPFGGAPLPGEAARATFEIVKVLKGAKELGKTRRIEVLYFGQHPPGTQFLVFGTDPSQIAWSTPTALSDRGVAYMTRVVKLAEKGPDRLAFFQDYFEDADPLLANDSYDEFARASYSEVKLLKERIRREKLLDWIKDPDVSASRRRLYLTMLGMCGRTEDVPLLEEMLKSNDRHVRSALDAMIACYVTLKGPGGMALVEDLFLKNKEAEYTDTYAAIMAVRFLGQETEVVPRERLMESLRYMLDRPQLADLVIPDLARWQDWSVLDKLVTLFKEADEESSWVRVPVVNYLRACPRPEAKKHLAELAKIDPDAVKRASSFFPLGAAAGASPAAAANGKKEAAGGAEGRPPKAGSGKGDQGGKNRTGSESGEDNEQGAALAPPLLLRLVAVRYGNRGRAAA